MLFHDYDGDSIIYYCSAWWSSSSWSAIKKQPRDEKDTSPHGRKRCGIYLSPFTIFSFICTYCNKSEPHFMYTKIRPASKLHTTVYKKKLTFYRKPHSFDRLVFFLLNCYSFCWHFEKKIFRLTGIVNIDTIFETHSAIIQPIVVWWRQAWYR